MGRSPVRQPRYNGATERKAVKISFLVSAFALLLCGSMATSAFAAHRLGVANGVIESTLTPQDGVRSFKGIPFARPPVGSLLWHEPQPVENWTGVRSAGQFGPHCMQVTTAIQRSTPSSASGGNSAVAA